MKTDMSKCAIACDLHDYIEIACLYHYQVVLTLRDQQTIEGKAIDTLTSTEKREYLIIDNGQKQQIELNQLKKLQVLTPNAQFTEVIF
ncbi:MAG: Rho-binding antiterminator [Methylomonas sp.]|uniref:Rho-binding antiterminator n=1 Tax=Methylomonas sp. TaxID=418 RepID=UPI0025DBE3C8|nr:Rho-binding antiterminator [Methylomonas sp.]MCK9609289.1 Rho-binding antiterminator [Methylomonas sp.]